MCLVTSYNALETISPDEKREKIVLEDPLLQAAMNGKRETCSQAKLSVRRKFAKEIQDSDMKKQIVSIVKLLNEKIISSMSAEKSVIPLLCKMGVNSTDKKGTGND